MEKEVVDVAIVAANYNNEAFLDDFFKSILNSTVRPAEIVFVDDCSTDFSLKVVDRFRYMLGLKVIALGSNVGFANALNAGIKEVTAKYILRIDPDDLLEKSRLEKQFRLLECGKYDIVGSNALYFDSRDNSIISGTNFPLLEVEIKKRFLKGEHGLLHGTVMGESILFKTELYRQEFVPAEDYDIFCRMMLSGAKMVNLSENLTYVRVHVNSVSNNIKFDTVKKTFELRYLLFGMKTAQYKKYVYYYHISYYRKYLFTKNTIKRLGCLLISALLMPNKLLRRLKI